MVTPRYAREAASLATGYRRGQYDLDPPPPVVVSVDTLELGRQRHDGWKSPREYQYEGIQFLRDRKRAMLTDAPGLGKTLQAAVAAVPPVLVSVPSYLVQQWGDFLCEQFGPLGQTVSVASGWYERRYKAIKARADWTVVNHEMLRDINTSVGYKFPQYRTVIFDESHHLRNRTAKKSLGALKVAAAAEYVFLLSATPIWKEADDLFMQLRIMWPDLFTSYYKFVDYFCNADTSRFGTKVLGIKRSRMKELDQMLQVCRLGRTYTDVGRQLPDLIEKYIRVTMPKELKAEYDKLKYSYKFEDIRFESYAEVLVTLRMVTAFNGKMSAVANIIEDIGIEPVVVYCWYRNTANMIVQWLKSHGISATGVTGDMAAKDRRSEALSGDNQVVVATIASLSEGIDLSHARHVIFAEEHYTPGSNYQALSRLRRERQPGEDLGAEVIAYYVHVRGTVDEVIHKVSRGRTVTIKEVLREALA